MSKPIVGAQLYTCRQSCKTIPDIAETLKKVAEIGYTTVQISGFGPVEPTEVMKIVADNGLTVAATHTGWARFREDLDGVIEEHKIYKCAHPSLGGLPEDYRSAEGLKRFVDEIAPIAEELAAEGMDFSYHNHSQELARYGEKTWLEMLYEQSDPAHVKDMAVTPQREQRFAEIGEGNLNWPAILDACEAGGVEYALVEQDQCYDRTPLESLATSYRNLQAMGLS